MPKSKSENLAVAKKILQETRDIIKGGDNFGRHAIYLNYRGRPASGYEREFGQYHQGVGEVRNLRLSKTQDCGMVDSFEENINLLTKYGLENCEGCALAALYACLKHKIRAEMYTVTNGEPAGDHHAFLVIGRDPESNPSDPSTWGEDAIIVDAWDGYCYPASELYTRFLTIQLLPPYEIAPKIGLSTTYLNSQRTYEKLLEGFSAEKFRLLKSLDQMEKISSVRLPKSDKEKMQKKITAIREQIATLFPDDFVMNAWKKAEAEDQAYQKQLREIKTDVALWPGLDCYSLTRQNIAPSLNAITQQTKFIQQKILELTPQPTGFTRVIVSFNEIFNPSNCYLEGSQMTAQEIKAARRRLEIPQPQPTRFAKVLASLNEVFFNSLNPSQQQLEEPQMIQRELLVALKVQLKGLQWQVQEVNNPEELTVLQKHAKELEYLVKKIIVDLTQIKFSPEKLQPLFELRESIASVIERILQHAVVEKRQSSDLSPGSNSSGFFKVDAKLQLLSANNDKLRLIQHPPQSSQLDIATKNI